MLWICRSRDPRPSLARSSESADRLFGHFEKRKSKPPGHSCGLAWHNDGALFIPPIPGTMIAGNTGGVRGRRIGDRRRYMPFLRRGIASACRPCRRSSPHINVEFRTSLCVRRRWIVRVLRTCPRSPFPFLAVSATVLPFPAALLRHFPPFPREDTSVTGGGDINYPIFTYDRTQNRQRYSRKWLKRIYFHPFAHHMLPFFRSCSLCSWAITHIWCRRVDAAP